MTLSARPRLVLRILIVAAPLLASAGIGRELFHRIWLRELDSSLLRDAENVGRTWQQTRSVTCCPPVEAPAGTSHGHSGQTYFEIRSSTGRVLARSPLLGKARWPDMASDSLLRFAWYHDFYLHRMRYVAMRLDPSGTDPSTVYFARDHGELEQRYRDLDALLLTFGALLAGGGAFLPIGRMLSRRKGAKGGAPSSILARLLTGSVLISSAILSLAGWATYAVVERGWLVQMDQALENRALGLAALCSNVDGNWRFEGSHLENSMFQDPKSMQYFEARDEKGRRIGRSASLGHLSFPSVALAPGERRFDWFHPGFLHKTRYVAISLAGSDRGLTVYFGQDYRDMKAKLRDLRNLLVGIWIASEILLCALLAILVHLSLAPLRRIAKRLESIDEEHLKGFESDGAPSEVRPLVEALSETLSRLDKAFKRERTLVADLAHEIRTPMAGIRTTLEVGVGDDEEHARLAMAASLSILSRMQSLMDALLSLARLEDGQIPSSAVPMDLAPLLGEEVDAWRGKCEQGGVELRTELAPALPSISNPEWCRVILRNLLDNAVAHTHGGTWIALRSEMAPDRVRIQVSNDGSRLETSDAAKVFDRFWRKDDSRNHAGNHAGLGLALCRELAMRMGGTMTACVPEPGEFRIEIVLPVP